MPVLSLPAVLQQSIFQRYIKKLEALKAENEKINIFNTYFKTYKAKYSRKITDEQAVFSDYVENKELAIESMADLLLKRRRLKKYVPDIPDTEVIPETNPVDKYRFVSKLQVEKINNDYILGILKSIVKRGKSIDTQVITELDLKNMIKNYPNEDEVTPLEVLKTKIDSKLDSDFKIRNTIAEENMDVYDEVSSGFDAQMYFTLLSGEMRDKGRTEKVAWIEKKRMLIEQFKEDHPDYPKLAMQHAIDSAQKARM